MFHNRAVSKLRDAFTNLARAQIKTWTIPVSFGTDEDETSNSMDPQYKKAEEAVSKEESAYQTSIHANATIDEDENDTTAHALDEVLQKGRLKRSKILSTIHNTISSDFNNSKEQLDVIHNREKWLRILTNPICFRI